ncbi:MAG: hypothetical protein FD189_398 [Elusimicrobia bacterium]|nr:MAG: hypothetical protein FD154_478 [Elusimicrobiota bacterium]KAF0157877.1 MAG: hypothetical protein FD189_398 [Elusimicrobiota bacterium]
MKMGHFVPAIFFFLAGCAVLQPHKKEMDAAAAGISAAELRLKAARDAGAAVCASRELKSAESELRGARSSQAKKSYAPALALAKASGAYSDEALKKCEEARRKEAEKAKAKKKK